MINMSNYNVLCVEKFKVACKMFEGFMMCDKTRDRCK